MTASIVDGLTKLDELDNLVEGSDAQQDTADDQTLDQQQSLDAEPSLAEPSVGKPISHGQIVDIWKKLRASKETSYTLEELLRGSQVYIPPPPPKPEPVGLSTRAHTKLLCC